MKFTNSARLTVFLLSSFLIVHVGAVWETPENLLLPLIWCPIIVFCTLQRLYLIGAANQLQAHYTTSRTWMLCLICGSNLQMLAMWWGVHPTVTIPLFFLYMMTYLLCFFLMHLQHFEFHHKMIGCGSVILSLMCCGWTKTWQSWTIQKQPHDSIVGSMMVFVGIFLGREVETLLRMSFLQRHADVAATRDMPAATALWPKRYQHNEIISELEGRGLEVLGVLGRGSSGEVFLVSSQSAYFAMKRCPKKRLSASQLERVHEECAILRRISFPFLVHLEEVIETPRALYLTMTYAGGGNLSGWIDRFTASNARVIISEVLLALEYLHTESIIYRDVKLENTLVGQDGHVLLADFGVSKRVDRLTGGHASTDSLVGTPAYMSPEQLIYDESGMPIAAGLSYSFYVDFWAAAVMLHEILTERGIGTSVHPQIEPPDGSSLMDLKAHNLLSAMLMPDREKRLGCSPKGIEDIKGHQYFEGMDWIALKRKEGYGPLRLDASDSPTNAS